MLQPDGNRSAPPFDPVEIDLASGGASDPAGYDSCTIDPAKQGMGDHFKRKAGFSKLFKLLSR
jgi:hypothetical protein